MIAEALFVGLLDRERECGLNLEARSSRFFQLGDP
jgi:hypothetical protein